MESSWDGSTFGASDATLATGSAAGRIRVAHLASVDAVRGITVALADSPEHEVPARSTVAIRTSDRGRAVVVVFEDDDASRPIVTGLLLDQPVVRTRDVQVDGKRVRIEAETELVLRSGKASITLAADGGIAIRGMDIISRARGTHKVKGATVRIN